MPRPRNKCSEDGCDRIVAARGICSPHYARARNAGALPPRSRKPNNGECTAPGCEQPQRSAQLCGMHYQRMQRRGTFEPRVPPRGELAPGWVGEEATYRTVHSRLVAARGKAANYACVDCGGPAEEWSYDNNDPRQLIDERSGAYSVDMTRYEPRCSSCHRYFDRPLRTVIRGSD